MGATGTRHVWQQVRSTVFRLANVPALIAGLTICLLGYLADWQNHELFIQRLRGNVTDELSIIRARLEGGIARDTQIGRAVVAEVASHPDIDQTAYSAFVERLMAGDNDLRSVAAAPDMIIRLVHPLASNEAVLGLDYNTSPAQSEAAKRARDSGQLVLAGPLNLVQGGVGIVSRFPVNIKGSDGTTRFWGLVSVATDATRLFADSDLTKPDSPVEVAIRGRDGKGAEGELFFGRQDVFDQAPVRATVHLPSGTWELAGIPKGGWPTTSKEIEFFHALIVACGILVVVPILITGMLYSDRRRHIDELSRRGAELEKLSSRFQLALQTSKIGVWELNVTTNRLSWDDRMYELYGLSPGGPVTQAMWLDLLHPDDRELARANFHDDPTRRDHHEITLRACMPDGSIRFVRAVCSLWRQAGDVTFIGLNWDITPDVRLHDDLSRAKSLAEARNAQLLAANERIEFASLHDALTGLPNRRYLSSHFANLESRPAEPGLGVAVLHLDLDRFKQVNDSFGHAAGDALLIHAARTLREVFRPDDFVARIGGDEFIAVCVDAEPADLASRLAAEVIAKFRQPVDLGGNHCRSPVSVGIACANLGADSLAQLMINADIALYRAKERGRSRFEFFTKALEAEVVTSKRIADEIITGLEENEFVPYYQPQYDAVTRQLAGVEALVRWRHPREGLLAPAAFLDIAEDINVLPTIDRIVLEAALADRQHWNERGLRVPKLAVNVSLNRLRDERLADQLERMAIAPGTLAFELTEAIYLDESDEVISENIRRVQQCGIDIEIDDFGTGYASVVSLTRLQPNRLKIARELTATVVASKTHRQIVRSIVEIGQAMGIGVIAEGVETMAQADILRDLGCDSLQGFAFAHPLDADAFFDFALQDRFADGEATAAPVPKTRVHR